jgi:hypothetical protein
MNKLVVSYFVLVFLLSATPVGFARSEELSYAMAKCQASVLKMDRLEKTYNEDGLKFQKVLYSGSEVLLMKPKWTGLNSHFTPFIKVFTYRYANAYGLDIDVTIESYCNEVPRDHLLSLFKKQRFSYTATGRPGCYLLDMRDSGTVFAQYRYGVMCLSKKNLMFAHLTPPEPENKASAPDKDEKEIVDRDLERLTAFYMSQLDKYVPKKFTLDLAT